MMQINFYKPKKAESTSPSGGNRGLSILMPSKIKIKHVFKKKEEKKAM